VYIKCIRLIDKTTYCTQYDESILQATNGAILMHFDRNAERRRTENISHRSPRMYAIKQAHAISAGVLPFLLYSCRQDREEKQREGREYVTHCLVVGVLSIIQQYFIYYKQLFLHRFSLLVKDHLSIKNGVFWDVTPCGTCKNRRFGGT
jgi:hypothetical protein